MRNIEKYLHLSNKIILCLLLFLISGCAFVNVSMVLETMPLEEQILEGKGRAKILLLDMSGFISEEERRSGLHTESSIVATVKEALQIADKDRDVVGVIIKINSPGGTVTASDIVYHELLSFKNQKGVPIYAVITDVGASGAYYVASAADKLMAHPTSITGSIGVVAMKFNIEGLMAKIGVQEETLKSADKKDMMSPFRPSTKEEKEILQSIMDSLHQRFVDIVAAGRKGNLSRKEVEPLADGRIYTSGQALESGLIDKIGYIEDAVEMMKESLRIDEARIVTYVRPGSYKGTIYSASRGPGVVNLININADAFSQAHGVRFMYLWSP
jgi:protease-4